MLTVRRATSVVCALALAALPVSAGAVARGPGRDLQARGPGRDLQARGRGRELQGRGRGRGLQGRLRVKRHERRRHRAHRDHRLRRRILLAGDPGVTIADFQFSPGTITIQAGETVTWTNNGPSAHTASASDGSFDTGTLQPGQSASHTFSQAGTFAYMCKIHPFMHGTIVVQGSAGSSAGSGSASSSPASPSASGTPHASAGSPSGGGASQGAAASASASLPRTGYDLRGALFCGGLLLLVGLQIRLWQGKRQFLHRK